MLLGELDVVEVGGVLEPHDVGFVREVLGIEPAAEDEKPKPRARAAVRDRDAVVVMGIVVTTVPRSWSAICSDGCAVGDAWATGRPIRSASPGRGAGRCRATGRRPGPRRHRAAHQLARDARPGHRGGRRPPYAIRTGTPTAPRTTREARHAASFPGRCAAVRGCDRADRRT